MIANYDDLRRDLIEINNCGKSWYRMSKEIGCAPGTLLRFIDEWGPRGPHLKTAERLAQYCGYEIRFVRVNYTTGKLSEYQQARLRRVK